MDGYAGSTIEVRNIDEARMREWVLAPKLIPTHEGWAKLDGKKGG